MSLVLVNVAMYPSRIAYEAHVVIPMIKTGFVIVIGGIQVIWPSSWRVMININSRLGEWSSVIILLMLEAHHQFKRKKRKGYRVIEPKVKDGCRGHFPSRR